MVEEILVYLSIFILALLVPLVYDLVKQHKWAESKKSICSSMPGLYRTLLAYGIIILVGIVILDLLFVVTSYIQPFPDTVKSLAPYFGASPQKGNTSMMALIKANTDAIATLNTSLIDVIKTVVTLLGRYLPQ